MGNSKIDNKVKREVVHIDFQSNINKNDKSVLAYCNMIYLFIGCMFFFTDDIYLDTKAFSYALLMFLIPLILKYLDMSTDNIFRKILKYIAIIFLSILLMFCISNFQGITRLNTINNIPEFLINNSILGYYRIKTKNVAFAISLSIVFELIENFSRVYLKKGVI